MNTEIKHHKKNTKGVRFGLIAAAVVLLILAWAGGYHYAERSSTTAPSVASRIVNGSGNPLSAGLRQFLTADIQRADSKKECLPGYESYSVLKQTATQAKLFSRCNGSSFPIDAVSIHGMWTLPSITDNFPEYPIPLCSYTQKNSISKTIETYCYQDTPIGTDSKPVIVTNGIE